MENVQQNNFIIKKSIWKRRQIEEIRKMEYVWPK
jgi:hypothetical protein